MDMRCSRRGRGVVAVTLVALLAQGVWGCAQTGYIKADDLETSGRGPSGCMKSCEDLGMRMAALVLVSNSIPGCVCQPINVQGAPPQPNAPAANAPAQLDGGAAASTTGYVVLAAAAAAQQQQQQQQIQAQQHQSK